MSKILQNPHGNCSLGGANATLSALQRVIPIYHSGPGCCLQTMAGEVGQSTGRISGYIDATSTPSTNMIENDIIFGAVEKLTTYVQSALEIMDADAFFILTGCTAGIIGDDVHSVARDFADRGDPVYAVDSAGFMGESYRGYEIAIQALLDNIVNPEPAATDPTLVNLLGIMPNHDPYWEGSLEELARLLEAGGLKVNTFFAREEGLAEVRASSSAALNIIVSPWLLKSAVQEYEDRFGIPSLRWPSIPVGDTDTTAFLRAVGKAVGREDAFKQVIVKEQDYLYHYLSTGIGVQGWRRFAIAGESAAVLGIFRFLANDFSFTPEVVVITDIIFRDEDKQRIEQQVQDLEFARPPKLFYAQDQWEIEQALAGFPEANLLIASSNEEEFALTNKLQFLPMLYPNTTRLIYSRTYVGYRGALTFLEDLYSHL